MADGGTQMSNKEEENLNHEGVMSPDTSMNKWEEENLNHEGVISPDTLMKNPLQNSWTLWFFKPDATKHWKENYTAISTFKTVEDFWSVYNNIRPASKLESGCDYCLFKTEIDPDFDNPQNTNGGRWIFKLTKYIRQTHLDDFWLETLLCLIGENFENNCSDEICGAFVKVRNKGDQIEMWLRDKQNLEASKEIGITWKKYFNTLYEVNTIIGFHSHKDIDSTKPKVKKCRMKERLLFEV